MRYMDASNVMVPVAACSGLAASDGNYFLKLCLTLTTYYCKIYINAIHALLLFNILTPIAMIMFRRKTNYFNEGS